MERGENDSYLAIIKVGARYSLYVGCGGRGDYERLVERGKKSGIDFIVVRFDLSDFERDDALELGNIIPAIWLLNASHKFRHGELR